MDGSRYALIAIRLIVAIVGGLYAFLRLVDTEKFPAFLKFATDVDVDALPATTNPEFSKAMFVLVIAITSIIAFFTIKDYIHEYKRYGDVLPVARWSVYWSMVFALIFFFYYTLLSYFANGLWGYLATLTLIQGVLVAYETYQNKQYDSI